MNVCMKPIQENTLKGLFNGEIYIFPLKINNFKKIFVGYYCNPCSISTVEAPVIPWLVMSRTQSPIDSGQINP